VRIILLSPQPELKVKILEEADGFQGVVGEVSIGGTVWILDIMSVLNVLLWINGSGLGFQN
jgi:hypothetical protein